MSSKSLFHVLTSLDRAATLYFFHPLRRYDANGHRSRIPVLMYHGICEGSAVAHPYYETITNPSVFLQQLRYLVDYNYRSVTLQEAVKMLKFPSSSPEKLVVITVDDALRNFYETALPTLLRYKLTATLFVPTGFITDVRSKFRTTECMTWSELREVANAGISIGSHTVSHPKLHLISRTEAVNELRDSKRLLEDKLGCPIDSFSYPFAFPEHNKDFKLALREMLVEQGYTSGVTTSLGTNRPGDDEFFLRRLPLNSYDDWRLLRAKLEGGYDWLHAIQYLLKATNTRIRPKLVQ